MSGPSVAKLAVKNGRVWIDTARWPEIRAAVETHSGGLIIDRAGTPVAALPNEEFATKDSELLACDVECRLAGIEGFYLELEIPGLDELIGGDSLMAILIDEKKRVLVQGITGREGRARTRLMREYGTNVVGGVTPGKGGQNVLGVPVFNTPQEAVNSLGNIDVSVVFVPAAGVKDAAISAIDAGIKLAVLVPDRVPVWDAMEIAAAAKANDAIFLGPNTLGR